MPNSYDDGRFTPDLRDDYEDCDPGIIAAQDGRLGLNIYGDGDADDADADYTTLHYRRNTRPLAEDVPDPFYKRRSL